VSPRHATDVVSLVFALIFAGLALYWALVVSDAVSGNDVWWIGPAILVLAGGAGLVLSLRPPAGRTGP
jgi:hypothetical protein